MTVIEGFVPMRIGYMEKTVKLTPKKRRKLTP